jgi:hypothetical protein
MKKFKSILKKIDLITIALILGGFGLIILISSVFLICKQYFILFSPIDSKIASELGEFVSGFVGIFWTASGVILIYATFKKQKELNEKQQFESSFFSLINTFNNLINTTKGYVNNSTNGLAEEFSGRDYFSAVLREVKDGLSNDSMLEDLAKREDVPEIKKFRDKINENNKTSALIVTPESQIQSKRLDFMYTSSKLSQEFIVAQYEYFFQRYRDKLGHYFRFLYNIFKYTIEENKKKKNAIRYLNIIQAQMSNDELGLLFYNALSKYGETGKGEKRFYNWLNDYDFLENIDENALIDKEHYKYYRTNFKFLADKEKNNKI